LNSVDFGATLINPLVKILIYSSKPPLFRAHFTSTFLCHLHVKKKNGRVSEKEAKKLLSKIRLIRFSGVATKFSNMGDFLMGLGDVRKLRNA
jgi:hypothetical protein